jgi:hypothetical protein
MNTCEDCNKITSGFCDKHLPEGFCTARQTPIGDEPKMTPEMEENLRNANNGIVYQYSDSGWTRQKAFEEAVKEMKQNGFTEQQAKYLLTLLDQFIPVI